MHKKVQRVNNPVTRNNRYRLLAANESQEQLMAAGVSPNRIRLPFELSMNMKLPMTFHMTFSVQLHGCRRRCQITLSGAINEVRV